MGRGLLGIVLVLAIMGGLAAFVIGRTSATTPVPAGTPQATAPGGAPAAAPVDHAALASACDADARAVEAAAQAYQAQTGAYPSGLAALVPGWLRRVPSSAHYTIYLDASGRVGVYPARRAPSGPVPDAADFDRHPSLCSTVPS